MDEPTPKATLAILWVARALGKGKPKKSRAGSWIKPAPPPDNADDEYEKIFTIDEDNDYFKKEFF